MQLSDFYNNAVQERENTNGSWIKRYYGIFTSVIDENNYKNVAEVGVEYGAHAKYTLKNTSIRKLYLIDPMQYYPNDTFSEEIMTTVPVVPGNNFNELYDLINNYLGEYSDKYTWYRTDSTTITNDQIEDGSLDCIFLDGRKNTYEEVLADLQFWWGKLHVGGKLLGYSYYMDSVKSAVDEFTTQNNLRCDLFCKLDARYPVYQFSK